MVAEGEPSAKATPLATAVVRVAESTAHPQELGKTASTVAALAVELVSGNLGIVIGAAAEVLPEIWLPLVEIAYGAAAAVLVDIPHSMQAAHLSMAGRVETASLRPACKIIRLERPQEAAGRATIIQTASDVLVREVKSASRFLHDEPTESLFCISLHGDGMA